MSSKLWKKPCNTPAPCNKLMYLILYQKTTTYILLSKRMVICVTIFKTPSFKVATKFHQWPLIGRSSKSSIRNRTFLSISIKQNYSNIHFLKLFQKTVYLPIVPLFQYFLYYPFILKIVFIWFGVASIIQSIISK